MIKIISKIKIVKIGKIGSFSESISDMDNRFLTNQSKSHGSHNLIVKGRIRRIGRIGKRFKTFLPKNSKSHGPHNLIVIGRIGRKGRIGKRFKTFPPKNINPKFNSIYHI